MKRILSLLLIPYFALCRAARNLHLRLLRAGRLAWLRQQGFQCHRNPFAQPDITLHGAQYMTIYGAVANHCILECWDRYTNNIATGGG